MLEDLKSFMTATVRTEVNAALDAKLEEKLAPIHQRLDIRVRLDGYLDGTLQHRSD